MTNPSTGPVADTNAEIAAALRDVSKWLDHAANKESPDTAFLMRRSSAIFYRHANDLANSTEPENQCAKCGAMVSGCCKTYVVDERCSTCGEQQ